METDEQKVDFKLIPLADVPASQQRVTKWDELFEQIPKGQAMVLSEPKVNSTTVRAALKRRQDAGKFKNLRMLTRGKHGSATVYISNIEKITTKTLGSLK